jgi:hypothetical protein
LWDFFASVVDRLGTAACDVERKQRPFRYLAVVCASTLSIVCRTFSLAMSKSSSMTPTDANGVENQLSTSQKSFVRRSVSFLQTDVDAKRCNPVSIFACFLTGFTSAPSFSVRS